MLQNDPLPATLSELPARVVLGIVRSYKAYDLKRRSRKSPCERCNRTLLNAEIRSPKQVLFGGWTCICGHKHHTRRGLMASPK